MWNRVERTLTDADKTDLKTAFETFITKLPQLGLTPDEKRKGGWSQTKKSVLMYRESLVMAKQRPAEFPLIDVAAFERDVKLMDDLHELEMEAVRLASMINAVRRWTIKDVSEQSRYVYRNIKTKNDFGGGEDVAHNRLKKFMPRSKG